MSPLKKELQARAGYLTDVEIRPSKFGPPTAFWVNGKEFAHFRKTDAIEIRLTRALIKNLKPDYRLETELRRDWAIVHFETYEDLDYAMKLLEKAYREYR